MENIFKILDMLIQEKRPELYEALQEGVSQVELETVLGNLYKSTPKTLRNIWLWHNGQNQAYYGDFHPSTNEMLMSVENSIETMEMLNEYVESGDISPNNWNQNWLPFTENGGGNYMCVSLDAGEVCYYDKYETSTGRRYESVENWLEDLIEGYKNL